MFTILLWLFSGLQLTFMNFKSSIIDEVSFFFLNRLLLTPNLYIVVFVYELMSTILLTKMTNRDVLGKEVAFSLFWSRLWRWLVNLYLTRYILFPLIQSPHSARVWTSLLSDHLILIILASIWLSSSAMSILEPCLPIWLMSHVKPEVMDNYLNIIIRF